jgi:hypothetical protein
MKIRRDAFLIRQHDYVGVVNKALLFVNKHDLARNCANNHTDRPTHTTYTANPIPHHVPPSPPHTHN